MTELSFHRLLGPRDTIAMLGAPGVDATAVTASDETVYDPPFRYLRVGGAGNVTITKMDGTDIQIEDVLAGDVIWLMGTKVKAATTATKVTAFF